LLCMVVFGYAAKAQTHRPNFIIVIGDDISWNDLGCYGNPVVRTPHIDRLASQGIKYNSSFLTASSCSPSRCSIIAGRYPHNTGAAELHTPLPKGMPTLPGELKKSGYYTAAAGKWHLGPHARAAFDLVVEQGNGVGGEEKWVATLQERPKDKPFFMWFASFDAHRDWQPDKQRKPHDAAQVRVPPYLVDGAGTRQDLAFYYDEIQRLDGFVGAVVQELRNQAILENTLILVMADNGRPFPRAKTRVYDSGMKTPFVLHWPEGIRGRGFESNSLISVIDIAPTFLELAGLQVGATFQGVSFRKCIKNPHSDHRQYIFAEHNWHDYEAHERMVRTGRFLYVVNNRPNLANQGPADSNRSPSYGELKSARDAGILNAAQVDVFMKPRAHEELFDCLNDPEQLCNIAANESFRDTLALMRHVLDEWIIATGDDVPDHLTSSWYDSENGKPLPKEQTRGEMPGSKHNATGINRKGPF
jgi:N-sulfoglucosamine sulfohydrolase